MGEKVVKRGSSKLKPFLNSFHSSTLGAKYASTRLKITVAIKYHLKLPLDNVSFQIPADLLMLTLSLLLH